MSQFRSCTLALAAALGAWTVMVPTHALAQRAHASGRITHEVSVRDYNLLRFSRRVNKAILAPGAPLAGAPYYLNDNHTLLLRFTANSHKPVQVVVELVGGSTRVLELIPTKGIAGQIINVTGSAPNTATAVLAPINSMDPNARYVATLSLLVRHIVPGSYHLTSASTALDYTRLRLVPLRAWAQSPPGNLIIAYRVVPTHHARMVLDPAQFYRPGVEAVLLTRTRLDATHHPLLYVVEHAPAGTH